MNRNTWIAIVLVLVGAWFVGMSSLAILLWYHNMSMPVAAANVDAFKFRFGTLTNDGNGKYSIAEETTTIPVRYGDSSYGFEVIPPDDKPYTVKFVYHFPYAPKVITGDVFDSNTPDATMRSKRIEMHGGFVEDLGFDPGDPVGEQSIDILIDDKLAKTFKFTVVAPADAAK